MRDLVGAMEVHTLVQSKTIELKDMQQRFKTLEESLTGRSQQELLSNGKQRVALVTIEKLQKKAEVLHFSIQRRTRDISKVAGMHVKAWLVFPVFYWGDAFEMKLLRWYCQKSISLIVLNLLLRKIYLV